MRHQSADIRLMRRRSAPSGPLFSAYRLDSGVHISGRLRAIKLGPRTTRIPEQAVEDFLGACGERAW